MFLADQGFHGFYSGNGGYEFRFREVLSEVLATLIESLGMGNDMTNLAGFVFR